MPRETNTLTVVIASGAALSGAFDMSRYAGGIILTPGTWTAADLAAKVADSREGTYVPLKDRSNGYGTDVSLDAIATGAASAYPIPPFWFGAGSIKLWSHDGAGADVNQAGARTLTLILKT